MVTELIDIDFMYFYPHASQFHVYLADIFEKSSKPPDNIFIFRNSPKEWAFMAEKFKMAQSMKTSFNNLASQRLDESKCYKVL